MGDCLGSYWERMSWRGTHPIGDVEDKLKEQTRQAKSGKAPLISYTDDSAMTLAMAKSLIDSNGFNSLDMAKKYLKTYAVYSLQFFHTSLNVGSQRSTSVIHRGGMASQSALCLLSYRGTSILTCSYQLNNNFKEKGPVVMVQL